MKIKWLWFFLYSQSLLCRVQEKNKSLDHCCSHSLYCHEQFHWVQVSNLSYLTLYMRLGPLFQQKWRKQQQQHNHLCALMLQAQLHFGALCDFIKPKLKLQLISLFFCHTFDKTNKQRQANQKATSKVCLQWKDALKGEKFQSFYYLTDWPLCKQWFSLLSLSVLCFSVFKRNFLPQFFALIIKGDSVSEFSHQAIIYDWVWVTREPSGAARRELSASITVLQRPTAGLMSHKHNHQ